MFFHFYLLTLEASYAVGKSPTYGGKKKDVSSIPHWVGAGNSSAGPTASNCFKNQKPQPKPRGSDKKFKSKFIGNTVNGTFRKNGHQVLALNVYLVAHHTILSSSLQVNDSNDPDLEYVLPEKWKKENLAHLLNSKFQLAPRDSVTSPYWRATHSAKDKYYHNSYTSCHSYSKDHYLQAK